MGVIKINNNNSLEEDIKNAHEKIIALRKGLFGLHDFMMHDIIKLEKEIEQLQEELGVKQPEPKTTLIYNF